MTQTPPLVARTRDEVEYADVEDLLMMTREQVDAMDPDARTRRVERMMSTKRTWTQHELATFLGCKLSTVQKWQWRADQPALAGRNMMILPKPMDNPPSRAVRGSHIQWPIRQLLICLRKHEVIDRNDLVPFPDGRRRSGREPRATQAARLARLAQAPQQRGSRVNAVA